MFATPFVQVIVFHQLETLCHTCENIFLPYVYAIIPTWYVIR